MRIRAGLLAAARGLSFVPLVGVSMALFVLSLCSTAFVVLGVGLLLTPVVATGIRRHIELRRRLALDWYGVSIPPRVYRPLPERQPGLVGVLQRSVWILTDPTTWRDLRWLVADFTGGFVLVLGAPALVAEGLYGFVLAAGLWRVLYRADGGEWYTFIHVTSPFRAGLAGAWGAVLLVAGLWWGPRIMRLHAQFTRALLAPGKERDLAERVAHLTETRSDAVDVSAAELRRIERDLHDGAQARLVAMGMSLGAIEKLVDEDPAQAKALLAQTRESSARALTDLRELVRGIHPPVLAERGLGDAVRALALDARLRTQVHVELPGRFSPPVEAAVYFAVAEVLANAAKHADADTVWIDIRYQSGRLRVMITDNGRGGADMARGTGLRGVQRRLGTFDGVLSLKSPQGGPTLVTMELPCELSLPKTSSS